MNTYIPLPFRLKGPNSNYNSGAMNIPGVRIFVSHAILNKTNWEFGEIAASRAKSENLQDEPVHTAVPKK